MLLPSRTLKS